MCPVRIRTRAPPPPPPPLPQGVYILYLFAIMAEQSDERCNQPRNVGGIGLGGWFPIKFTQRLAGDGADGDCWNTGEGPDNSSSAGSLGQMRGAGGAGKGSCVDSILKSLVELLRSSLGKNVAVGVHYIDHIVRRAQ